MDNEKLNILDLLHFTPKQLEALELTKRFRYVLFGGAMGGGKSYWLRWMLIYWLLRYAGKQGLIGVRVGLFCEDYPSLNDRHLLKVDSEFPAWLGTLNKSTHDFTLAPEFGGGILSFRNLDDASKYQSSEFAIVAVDEVNKNPLSKFQMLRTRMRWGGIPRTKFFGACNPGGEAWLKQYFVDRLFPPEEQERNEFSFIQALPIDNPHLDPLYRKSLESLPEEQRQAFLNGKWDAFEKSIDEHGYSFLLSDSEVINAISDDVMHVGSKVLGVDPAAGGDASTIVKASETLAEIVFNTPLNDTMDLVSLIVKELESDKSIRQIAVDVTGVGRGVYDRLREVLKGITDRSFVIHPVLFGGIPFDKKRQRQSAEYSYQIPAL